MADFKVIIGGREFDGIVDGDIAISSSINKLQSIENRNSPFSTDIEAARTPNNRIITGNVEQVNTDSPFGRQRLSAQIEVNGVTVIDGFHELDSTDENYVISIFGGSADLAKLFDGKKLSGLYLGDLDYTWNLLTIQGGRLNVYTQGYIFPNINYGKWTNRTLPAKVDYGDMYPAMYCWFLIKRMFNVLGYYVDGEVLDNPLFQSMILPMCQFPTFSDVYKESLRCEAFTTIVQTDTDPYITIPFQNITKNPNTAFLNSNFSTQIRPPILARWRVTIDFTITIAISNVIVILYKRVKQRTGEYKDVYLGSTSYTISGTYSFVVEDNYTSSSDYYFPVIIDNIPSVGVVATHSIDVGAKMQLEIIANDIAPGGQVIVADALPDVTQTDFLMYIANAFGVMFKVDANLKKVTMVPYSRVNANKAIAKDWSNKVDTSTHPVVTYKTDGYGQNSFMRYEYDENDSTLRGNPDFGFGVLKCNDETLDQQTELYKAPFAPITRRIGFNAAGSSTVETAYIELFLPDGSSFRTQSIKPRVGYVEQNSSNIISVGTDVGGTITSGDSPTVSSEVFFDNLIFGSSLMPRNYGLIQQILNAPYVLTIRFNLNAADMNQLDHTVPVWIDITLVGFGQIRGYFYVNDVNQYKVNAVESTEVELIRI